MVREVTVAATQFACAGAGEAGPSSDTASENIGRAVRSVREAAAAGAQIVCVQELFAQPYFCATQTAEWLAAAVEVEASAEIEACLLYTSPSPRDS